MSQIATGIPLIEIAEGSVVREFSGRVEQSNVSDVETDRRENGLQGRRKGRLNVGRSENRLAKLVQNLELAVAVFNIRSERQHGRLRRPGAADTIGMRFFGPLKGNLQGRDNAVAKTHHVRFEAFIRTRKGRFLFLRA